MKMVLPQINLTGACAIMSVTYTATLSVWAETVLYLSRLLHAERRRRGTRSGTRTLSCFKQAVLVIRWLLDATRVRQLAVDNAITVPAGWPIWTSQVRPGREHDTTDGTPGWPASRWPAVPWNNPGGRRHDQ